MKKVKCPQCLGTGVVQDQALIGAAMRRRRKVSLTVLARGMGITPSHLCYLEQGKRRWSEAMIEKYKECCR